MIVAENLSKSYSGHKAIDGVSFTIRQGEIVGLLGLNGAGKSTILKILGCFLLPSGGRATVDGHSVDENPHAVRKVIGYLPDRPPLYDEMSVESYLRYVAKLKDVPGSEVDGKVRLAMQKTNVDRVKDQRVGELSHGFRQRVGIAQALVHDPKVLILDEPINGLDPVQIVEMRDLITSLKGKHTVVLSSHILSEITRTCDRILIVDHGRLVAQGTEDSLKSTASKRLKIFCDVEQVPGGLKERLGEIRGVTEIVLAPTGFGSGQRLTLTTEGDLRSEIAKVVVGSGAGLIGLTTEGGLEGLFMQLIKPKESGEGRHV